MLVSVAPISCSNCSTREVHPQQGGFSSFPPVCNPVQLRGGLCCSQPLLKTQNKTSTVAVKQIGSTRQLLG